MRTLSWPVQALRGSSFLGNKNGGWAEMLGHATAVERAELREIMQAECKK